MFLFWLKRTLNAIMIVENICLTAADLLDRVATIEFLLNDHLALHKQVLAAVAAFKSALMATVECSITDLFTKRIIKL